MEVFSMYVSVFKTNLKKQNFIYQEVLFYF